MASTQGGQSRGLSFLKRHLSKLTSDSGVTSHPTGNAGDPIGDKVPHSQFETGKDASPWKEKTVLGFDGGGIRGYWSLLVLKALMQDIKKLEEEDLDHPTEHSFHPCDQPPSVSWQGRYTNDDEYTRFLPCHYFDYIGGTSTGALISIMLSQFRMPVEDCIYEYKTMAGMIFSHPRWFSVLGFTHGTRCKYSATNMENAIITVIGRRKNRGDPLVKARDVPFSTRPGLCRGIALTIVENAEGSSARPGIIRSYGNGLDGAVRSAKLGEMPTWMAARAATAAPLYFKKLALVITEAPRNDPSILYDHTGPSSRLRQALGETHTGTFRNVLSDAGVSRRNNPCKDLLKEVDDAYQNPKVTLVSIGTARPSRVGGDGVIDVVRNQFHDNGNPEDVHMELLETAKERIRYFRLDKPCALELKLDDWKPKATGADTLSAMQAAFDTWRNDPANNTYIRNCARRLVDIRRGRTLDRESWDRFALGQAYVCQEKREEGTCFMKSRTRTDFVDHLVSHKVAEHEIDAKVASGTLDWEYH